MHRLALAAVCWKKVGGRHSHDSGCVSRASEFWTPAHSRVLISDMIQYMQSDSLNAICKQGFEEGDMKGAEIRRAL